jgi:hypothetical protein
MTPPRAIRRLPCDGKCVVPRTRRSEPNQPRRSRSWRHGTVSQSDPRSRFRSESCGGSTPYGGIGGPGRTRTCDQTVMSAEKILENCGKPDFFVQSRSISFTMISRAYFLTVSRRVSRAVNSRLLWRKGDHYGMAREIEEVPATVEQTGMASAIAPPLTSPILAYLSKSGRSSPLIRTSPCSCGISEANTTPIENAGVELPLG